MVLLPLTFLKAMRKLRLAMIVLRQHYRLSCPGKCDAKTGTACAVPAHRVGEGQQLTYRFPGRLVPPRKSRRGRPAHPERLASGIL